MRWYQNSNSKKTKTKKQKKKASAFKDTEAAVGDLQVPEVDAEVVRGQIRLVVAVDRDGVDMVGVSVGEHPPGTGFHHEVHGYQHRHLRSGRKGEKKGTFNLFSTFNVRQTILPRCSTVPGLNRRIIGPVGASFKHS